MRRLLEGRRLFQCGYQKVRCLLEAQRLLDEIRSFGHTHRFMYKISNFLVHVFIVYCQFLQVTSSGYAI